MGLTNMIKPCDRCGTHSFNQRMQICTNCGYKGKVKS